MDVGLTVTDRVTYHGLQWFAGVDITSNATLQHFLDYVGCALCRIICVDCNLHANFRG